MCLAKAKMWDPLSAWPAAVDVIGLQGEGRIP